MKKQIALEKRLPIQEMTLKIALNIHRKAKIIKHIVLTINLPISLPKQNPMTMASIKIIILTLRI